MAPTTLEVRQVMSYSAIASAGADTAVWLDRLDDLQKRVVVVGLKCVHLPHVAMCTACNSSIILTCTVAEVVQHLQHCRR